MSIQRVAVVFDDQVRPDTTGVYCLRALSQLIHAVHISPADLAQIQRGQFDLIVNIDDGLRYIVPSNVAPCALWAIDTHLAPEWAEEKGKTFDWLFAAQKDGAERLCQAGLPTTWLPLAFDPEIHRPHATECRWDVGFVGNLVGQRRRELLALIQQRYTNSFIGQAYFDELAQVYSSCRIGFNCSIRNDINMRVFETLGCGTMLLTNELGDNGQEELLRASVHIETYRDSDELFDKISFYLNDEAGRMRIAQAGREEVLANHTYRHRMQRLLERVEQDLSTISVPGAEFPAIRGECPSNWMDQIDIVIKTFLRPAGLLQLLKSILSYYPTARITIADDGGLRQATDADSQLCKKLIADNPGIQLFDMPFAAGVVAGRNLLVSHTQRPYILFLDDDFCFTADTRVDRLFSHLEAAEDIGVAAGVCMDVIGKHRTRRNSGGTLKIDRDVLFHDTQGWNDQPRMLCDYVPTFMLCRRDVFRNVRWDLELGGEHYDFLMQLRNSQWKVIQDESVLIEHHPACATLDRYRDYRDNTHDAQQDFLKKWKLRRMVQDGKVILESEPNLMSTINTEARPAKDDFYFEFLRPDVLELVPLTARRVLDIGCGGGKLGAQLRERQNAFVCGIEMNSRAAKLARQRLNDLYEQDIEHGDVDFAPGSFDCVICADVLEHLRDPATVLSKVRRWLIPGGCLIASIPNVRHHTVLTGLLAGNWTYESAGLLDIDHVRFYTRREIEKLLYRTGFVISDLRAKPSPDHAIWVKDGRSNEIHCGHLRMSGLRPAEMEELFVYQYLVQARLNGQLRFGLTSIVLVTFNQLAFTRECIDSIRLRTDEPYELICVDNGSTDGTAEYLHSLPAVRVILNSDNRGFPRAVNQGLHVANGEQILLLNNDTVVTTGWLRRMLTALHSSSDIGLVGPCSNYVGSSQQIPVTYQSTASVDGFAWDWGQSHSGQIRSVDRLVGFCLLFKREVLDVIGVLDERFGIGCFEDDDYCYRALKAGYRCVVAVDSFVHHYGHRTFLGSGINLQDVLDENKRRYDEKWSSETKPLPDDAPAHASDTSPEVVDWDIAIASNHSGPPRVKRGLAGGLLLTDAPIRLSLCMIVRDNEKTIGPCLASIQPWVDEMVIVDTGSRDKTREICRYYGARIIEFPWIDDFSAARNVSLDHARGQWIFWMDSDDTIPAEQGRQLRELVDGPHSEKVLGYVMQVRCPGKSENGHSDVTIVDHIKLFLKHPKLRFEHRIHEQILPAIRRLAGAVRFTDIHVVHSGSDHTSTGRALKLERDYKLLMLDLKDHPDHPFVLFNLGMTHADAGEHKEAIRHLTRCLDVSCPEESHVAKAYALLISSLQKLEQFDVAGKMCEKGRSLFPDDKELLFRQAMLAHHNGQLEHAVSLYRRVLTPSSVRRFVSVDADLAGYKAHHNLALAYEDLGWFIQAEEQWRTILYKKPDLIAGQVGLAECFIKQSRIDDATELIATLKSNPRSVGEGYRLEATCAERQGDSLLAIRVLETGIQSCSESVELLRHLARLHYSRRDLDSASEALECLTEMAPNDRSAWNNLGVVLSESQQIMRASRAFQRASELVQTPRQVAASNHF